MANERSELLSVDGITATEYTKTYSQSWLEFLCMNKKPLIVIVLLIVIGSTATVVVLLLDHSGYFNDPIPVIDKTWFKQLLTNTTNDDTPGLFSLWFEHSKHDYDSANSTLSLTQFGRRWDKDPNQNYNFSTILSQSQLIYDFAMAFQLLPSYEKSYFDAMQNGINVLMFEFYDSEYGGFYFSVNQTQNSTEIDYTKDAVGHAMLIEALTLAYSVTPESVPNHPKFKVRVKQLLTETYETYSHFYDSYGGLFPNLSRNFTALPNEIKSQIPIMYYFSALSRMVDAIALNDNDLNMTEIKEELIDFYYFVRNSLLHSYNDGQFEVIYESYETDWTFPLSNEQISLGNAYRWSRLVSVAVFDLKVIANDSDSEWMAVNFVNYAIALGSYNETGHVNDDPYDLKVDPPFWCVCDAIEALDYYWNKFDKWSEILQNTVDYFQSKYFDQTFGGIYFSPKEKYKGNVTKVDYNCVRMAAFVGFNKY